MQLVSTVPLLLRNSSILCMITILDIRVRFAAKRYAGSEAAGFVLVTLELLGGVSTKPFSVSVTPSELLPASAKGMIIPYIANCSRWKSFIVVN